MKTFLDVVSPKRKKLDGEENRWISGCTMVAQLADLSG
jgi:hypothetical protein